MKLARTRRSSFAASCAPVVMLAFACKRDEQPKELKSPTSPGVPLATVAPGPSVMPSSKVLAVTNPAGLPVYSGPTGTLEGVVYVEGAPAPDRQGVDFTSCPAGKDIHGKLFRDQAVAEGKRALLDAVVGITGYKDVYVPATSEAVQVEIRNCGFEPRTVVLSLGQRLDVLNREAPSKDKFFAPDLSTGAIKVLNLAAPGGDPVHLYPSEVGRVMLVDQMNHTYMSADVFVGAHALATVTRAGGFYRITGVPIGKLNVTAFHPAFRNANAKAKVEAGIEAFAEPIEIRANAITAYNPVLRYQP
jgi:hypothetical protein